MRISPAASTCIFTVVALTLLGAVRNDDPIKRKPQPEPGSVIDADDYPDLQAAIDAAPITGAVVQLGARTYEISKPLIIRHEDMHLRGVGTVTHIKNQNENGEPALVIAPDTGFISKTEQKERLWRVHVSSLRITGNPKSGHGIVVKRIQEFFLQGVTVSEHGGDGVHCEDCYEDMRLSHCLITYNAGAGLYAKGNHDTIVSDTQFEENQDAVRYLDGFNLCMTGNNLDDHLRHGVVVENTYGSIISGNMIEECQGWAVILDRDCYGIAVSSNVIAHEFTGGVDLRDAHSCTVSANAIPLCKEAGVRVGPQSDRIAITGNSFGDSYIGKGKVLREGTTKIEQDKNQSAGVVLQETSDVTITGNTFSGSMPKALSVNGKVHRVVFSSNVIAGTHSDHAKLQTSIVSANLFAQESTP